MSKNLLLLVACLLGITSIVFSQKRATGLNFDLPSYRGTPYKMKLTSGAYASLPASASMEQYCPTPGDQGNYGTCVAFASAYHMRTIMLAQEQGITDKSKIDELVFSPSFVYETIKDPADILCEDGSSPINALELFKTIGAATLKTLPYECGAEVNSNALLEATAYGIRDYQILFLPDEEDESFRINAIKKGLAEGYPILLCMILPNSFYDPTDPVWIPTSSDTGPSGDHGRHAMCIVGYDDNQSGGAFRVLNSWGANWRDGGYVWIRYADLAKWALGALQAYPLVAPPAPAPAPAPTPTPSPTPTPTPTPQPAPNPYVPEIIKGNLMFQTNTGQQMPAYRSLTRNLVVEEETNSEGEDLVAYKMDKAYPSGTRFRFFITTNSQTYVYAFATDLTAKVNKIMPYDDLMSPLIGPNSTVAFPSETKVVRMDDQKGTDYLLVLYSQEPLDVATMLRTMGNTPGGLTSKIRAALGDRLVEKENINYDLNGIGFSVSHTASGDVVPLMVEIQHN